MNEEQSDPELIASDETPLTAACKNNSESEVMALLDRNENVDLKNSYGVAPLHIACEMGNVAIVSALLKKGADVNVAERFSSATPLIIACLEESKEIVDLLLKHNADVNKEAGSLGTTALHTACRTHNEDIVRMLLENKADPNPMRVGEGNDHGSPLTYAVTKGRPSLVRLLLRFGADPKKPGLLGSGQTPFYLACFHNRKDILEILLQHDEEFANATALGLAPIDFANELKRVDVAETLLSNGADVNKPNDLGIMPLVFACSLKSPSREIIELILAHKHEAYNVHYG